MTHVHEFETYASTTGDKDGRLARCECGAQRFTGAIFVENGVRVDRMAWQIREPGGEWVDTSGNAS